MQGGQGGGSLRVESEANEALAPPGVHFAHQGDDRRVAAAQRRGLPAASGEQNERVAPAPK